MANLKSAIWNYFKVSENDKNKAICSLCSSESSQKYIVRGKSLKSHSTTPLWNHLQSKHPDVYGNLKSVGHSSKTDVDEPSKIFQKDDKLLQTTLESTFLKTKIWSLDDSRSKTITSKICELMALDAEPFSIVEREGFSQLIKHLAPYYPLPSRTYFENKALPELYEKVQFFILQDLKLAAYISFTTDIWTSSINNESFISLTAHFIDSTEMKQRICTLNCKHFPESHTGINISDILNEIFEDWKISLAQQHIIVRDNGANIKLATELLATETANCFIHTLQLVINEAILSQRAVIDILAKCRKIVAHFSHSPTATTSLKEIQENLKLPPHKLIQDVSTRWNSTYYMLQRLHEQRQAVTAYSAESDIPTITAYQWALIENILRILQPFEEITKQASSDKEIISFVIPAVATLKSYLSKRQKDEGVQTMKQALKSALENRFLNDKDNKINIQKEKKFCIATAVDPRFKSFFFNDVNKVKKWILMEMNETEGDMGKEIDEHDRRKNLTTEQDLAAEIHEDIWDCFSEFVVNKSNENDHNMTVAEGSVKREELEKYFSIPLIKRSENPIEWWKYHIEEFPRMKPLVLKYLSAPPSSVNSERLFSAAKRIYTDNRNRLAPKNAEKLLFIMKNMKYSKFPINK